MKRVSFPENVPITVLTAMNMPESSLAFLKGVNQIKLGLHKRWLTNAPHIHHVLAQRSDHYIHQDEPELVIEEIKVMIE